MGPGIAPYDLYQRMIADPSRPDVIRDLRELGYNRILIYISNVSLSRPGYIPPFAEYNSSYPKVNISFPGDNYDLIYDKGAYIFGFPKAAFS